MEKGILSEGYKNDRRTTKNGGGEADDEGFPAIENLSRFGSAGVIPRQQLCGLIRPAHE